MKLGLDNNTLRLPRGKRLVMASKVMGKGKKGRKIVGEWSRISKLDARVIVELLKEPFCPNEATIEARKLGESIRRLAVH